MRHVVRKIGAVGLGLIALIVSAAQDPIGWTELSEISSSTMQGSNYSATYRFTSHLPFTMPTPLTIQLIASSRFSKSDQCTGRQLQSNESCDVVVNYAPQGDSSSAYYQLVMRYARDVVPLPKRLTHTQSVSAPVVNLAMSATLPLSAQISTNYSYPVSFTLSNTTGITLTNLTLTANALPNDASFVPNGTDCGTNLGVNQSCSYSGIYITGSITGTSGVTLHANYDQNTNGVDDTSSTTISLPNLVINLATTLPAAISTNSTYPVSFTLTNNSSFVLTTLTLTPGATPNDANFIQTATDCGTSLLPNQTCTYTGQYTTGATPGSGTATINASYDQSYTTTPGSSTAQIATPNLQIQVQGNNALPLQVDTNTDTPVSFTLQNQSPFALTGLLFEPSASPVDADLEFNPSSTTCGSTLLPNQTCTVAGTYQTNALAGPGSAQIQVSYDQNPNVQTGTSSTQVVTTDASLVVTNKLPINSSTNSVNPISFQLTNNAAVPLTGLTLTQTSTLGSFNVTSNTCTSSLAPSTSCNYTGNYTAGTTAGSGSVVAQATFNEGSSNPSTTSTSVSAPNVTITPAVSPLPNNVSTNSAYPVSFTVSNQSAFAITGLIQASSATPTDADFQINTTTCGSSLGTNQTCQISGSYQTNAMTGSGSAQVYLSYDQNPTGQAVGTSPTTVTAPTLIVTPILPLPQQLGTNSPYYITFTLTNQSPFDLTQLTLIPTASNQATLIESSTDCTDSLVTGATCYFFGLYTSGTSVGNSSANLQIGYDQNPVGTQASTSTAIQNASVNFTASTKLPDTMSTQSTMPVSFTLVNTSAFPLTGLSFLPTASNGMFQVDPNATTCTSTLAVSANCIYAGNYTAGTTASAGSVAVQAQYDQGSSNQSSPTAISAPNLVITPTPPLPQNLSTNSSTSLTFTLTNNSTFTLTHLVLTPSATPGDASLTQTSSNCTSSLAPNGTCNFTGTYTTQTTTGPSIATLHAAYDQNSNGTNGISTTALSNPDVDFLVSQLPAAMNSGNIATVTFTLKNSSAFDLTSVTITSTNTNGSFSLNSSASNCSGTLEAGHQCNYSGTFTAGAIAGRANIVATATYSPQGTKSQIASTTVSIAPAIYVGVVSQGLYKSLDSGATFTQIAKNSIGNSTVSSLLVLGNTIYAATSNGLYQSTDTTANSFTLIAQDSINTSYVASLAIGNGVLYAGVVTDEGLYKSTNSGSSFTKVATVGGDSPSSLAVESDNQAVYVVGALSGLYQSLNNGSALTKVIDDVGLGQVAITSDDKIYAGSIHETNSLYRSNDGGHTFPLIPFSNNSNKMGATALLAVGSTIYVGTSQGTVYQGSSDGSNFIQIGSGSTGNNAIQSLLIVGNTVYAGTIGLYESTGGGAFTLVPSINSSFVIKSLLAH